MTSVAREPLVIADASPLIALAKIGRLPLLYGLATDVAVPRMVWIEVVEQGGGRPEVQAIISELRDCVRDPDDRAVARFISFVDRGEAAALALAIHYPGSLLLVDDAEGRRIGEANGIRFLGTVGLLLRAKRAGLIPFLANELSALREVGFFISEQLIQRLLQAAGESPDSPG